MKDYEYWRQGFISYYYDLVSHNLNQISKNNLTPIEGIVLFELIMLQNLYGRFYFNVFPQLEIRSYRVDFVVKLETPGQAAKRVVIECDGHNFHEKTKDQASKDKKRDRELQKMGYVVLRYSGSDIVNDPYKVAMDLEEILGIPEWAKPKPDGSEEV